MYKNKIVALLIASVLMLVIALPACTCGGAPEPAPEPAPAPAPEPEPAPAPAPEPEPEPAAATPGECAAPNTLFENDAITVCYPEKWGKNPLDIDDPAILLAADPAPSTPPVIVIYKGEAGASPKDVAYAGFEIVIDALAGPGTFDPANLDVIGETESTIASGEAATDMELKGDLMGFPVKAYATIADAGDASYMVLVVTVDIMAPYKKDQFQTICNSLFLK